MHQLLPAHRCNVVLAAKPRADQDILVVRVAWDRAGESAAQPMSQISPYRY